jgi:hypothetical protein
LLASDELVDGRLAADAGGWWRIANSSAGVG